MKLKWILCLSVITPWINGCDVKKESDQVSVHQTNYISVSSVPLIQQVLESNTPLFQERTNTKIMELVCQYVAGDISKESFDDYFTSRHVDIKKLAQQDAGFQFLADRTEGNYETGCASYIASKFFSYGMLTLDENITNTETLNIRLKQLTPTALKVAHYIAEIASANNQKYDSIDEYKSDVKSYISMSAKRFITSVMHDKYDPTLYGLGKKEPGITYEIKGDSFRLYIYDELWLGQGKAMGTEYKVSIKSNSPYS